jgi:hypothetical protein
LLLVCASSGSECPRALRRVSSRLFKGVLENGEVGIGTSPDGVRREWLEQRSDPRPLDSGVEADERGTAVGNESVSA